MYRTFIILRHTFLEAVVQPIYALLLAIGAGIIIVFSFLPFFTLSEDTMMYKSVCLDIILLLVLIVTLFATSKSIFEEIEDRTMLTLMSKPLRRWEVLVGKYLGIILAAAMGTAILGIILGAATWWRIPGDYHLRVTSIDDTDIEKIRSYRLLHINGLIPALMLKWLQISVLAAIGVAVSTRVSLVVNLPIVILAYLAGNMTRFLYPLEGQSLPARVGAGILTSLLPYLEIFDLNKLTVYERLKVGQFAADPSAWPVSTVWGYVALATAYAAAYSFFALTAGLLLFQNRELGGAEG